jgi:hypothetical protein
MAGPGAPEGNQNRANQYRIKRTFEKLLDEASSKREGLTKLEAMCKAQLEKAEEGDTQAFREVADRVDGKPKQQTELSGPDGSAIPMRTVVNFVSPGG